jgi:hypothetical protein
MKAVTIGDQRNCWKSPQLLLTPKCEPSNTSLLKCSGVKEEKNTYQVMASSCVPSTKQGTLGGSTM